MSVSKEDIERFKALHPERFAALEAIAAETWFKPPPPRRTYFKPPTNIKMPWWFERGLTFEQALEEIRDGCKVYLAHTSEHDYVITARSEEDVIEAVQQKHNEKVHTVEIL